MLFQKVEFLVKAVKKCFLKKLSVLARIYKSSVLSCKLLKRTMYVWGQGPKFVYWALGPI